MSLARASFVLFDFLLVTVLAWGLITAVGWPFETKLFPLTIGIPVLAIALAQLIKDSYQLLYQPPVESSTREAILDISVDTSVPAADVARRAGGFLAVLLVYSP